MSCRSYWLGIVIAVLGVAAGPVELPCDSIILKNGSTLTGLILEETPQGIRFQYVRRKPGRHTTIFTTTILRQEIAKIEALNAAQRAALREQLSLIERAPEIEKAHLDRVELDRVDWRGQSKAGLRYDSDYFTLVSNAQEALVRRAAVRLEQIYTAYMRYLPPRHPGGKPTMIILVRTLDEYRKMVMANGHSFENPAYYEPAANRIVCVSNITELGDDLEKIRLDHHKHWTQLENDESELRRLFATDKKQLARYLEPIQATKLRIAQADRYNESLIDKATDRLFAILSHEAFHAYTSGFVYPWVPPGRMRPDDVGELPRWLNEGLAQIFEASLIEAGELRVGHADATRLARCRQLLQKNEWLSLEELFKVGKREFIVGHGNRDESERVYLTSWTLAFYLMFERRLLGTPAMEAYVRAMHQGHDPIESFETLVGQPLKLFEADFRRYVQQLQPDGTTFEVKRRE